MDTRKLKELTQKISAGTASEEEKLEALKNLNTFIEEYSRALKDALAKNPE